MVSYIWSDVILDRPIRRQGMDQQGISHRLPSVASSMLRGAMAVTE